MIIDFTGQMLHEEFQSTGLEKTGVPGMPGVTHARYLSGGPLRAAVYLPTYVTRA